MTGHATRHPEPVPGTNRRHDNADTEGDMRESALVRWERDREADSLAFVFLIPMSHSV